MNARVDIPASAFGPIARAGGRDRRRLKVSFEFSPPKTPEAEESLWQAIRRLEPLRPRPTKWTHAMRAPESVIQGSGSRGAGAQN